jgi:hypothetical protein
LSSSSAHAREGTLRLEYACTKAELDEAESLALRQQLGGGSTWLTLFVLLAALALVLLALWMFVVRQLPAKYRAAAVAAFALIWIIIYLRQRGTVLADSPKAVVELSEDGVRVVGSAAGATMAWSHFANVYESSDLFVLTDRSKSAMLVLPKRAFPDAGSQDWFRARTLDVGSAADRATAASSQRPPASGEVVRLRFRYRFRDFLDRVLATWFVRVMMIGFACMMLGIFAHAALHPPPNAVYSPARVFLFFGLPFLVLIVAMVPLVVATREWLAGRRVEEIDVALREEGVTLSAMDSTATVGWEVYGRFKETPRSFIIWQPGGGGWLLLPKRLLADDQAARCRELLASRCTRSTWLIW